MVYDTESTGLWKEGVPATDPSQPSICQLGVKLYDMKWVCTGSFVALIKPNGWSIEPEAESHHGISEARCSRHGVPLVAALTVLQAFAANAKIIFAHNNEFDRRVVRAELARLGSDGLWWQRKASSFYCTMERATPVLQLPGEYGFKYPSLEEAHRFFYPELDYSTIHDADADTEATVRVYKALQKMGLTPEGVQ